MTEAVRSSDVFEALKWELDLVEERLVDAAQIDHPIASVLIPELVQAGGKRLRPLTLILSARAFTFDVELAASAAAAVELLHTASLIHDDTIDRAAIRRGTPTLNTQLSSGAVILIGDYLFAKSAILATSTENTRVVSIFATALADICDGQLRETLEAHQVDQDRDSYLKRIYGKTAALFAAAAEMGAVLAHAPEEVVQDIRGIGNDIGMAFQIVDDVLDLREGTQILGKPAGNDLRQGVMTLPTMLFVTGLDQSSPTRTTLEHIVAGDEVEGAVIDELVRDIRISGALDSAEQIAAGYTESAYNRLEAIPDAQTRDYFEDLLALTIRRQA